MLAAAVLLLFGMLGLHLALRAALSSRLSSLPAVAAAPGDPSAAPLTAEELGPAMDVYSSVNVVLECMDGVDNDGDGLVDYPDDPGCNDAWDLAEHDPVPPPPGSASLEGIGIPDGWSWSLAWDVSQDGRVVVGQSWRVSGTSLEYSVIRWEDGVLEVVEDLDMVGWRPDHVSVSGDGAVIVASGYDSSYHARSFRWQDGVVTELESPDGRAWGQDVSQDGSVVVGWVGSRSAARWDDGVLSILEPEAAYSLADAVSGDGSVAFGWADGAPKRWIGSDPTPFDLGIPGLLTVSPTSASADGSVLVGHLRRQGMPKDDAFLWQEEQTTLLAEGDVTAQHATDVSDDGRLVVGWGPSIWDASHHMRNVSDLLVNDYGISLGGRTLSTAAAISGDGRTVVGWGYDPEGQYEGWIVRLPPACSDGLDDDGDGSIDLGQDPGCESAASTNESPECDDGEDNDGDGGIDWDGSPADSDCGVAWHDDESVTYVPEPSGVLGLLSGVALLAGLARPRTAPLG